MNEIAAEHHSQFTGHYDAYIIIINDAHTDIYVIYQVEVVKTGYKPANITGEQNVVIINSCSKLPQSKSETQ